MEINTLTVGDSFGELSLMDEDARAIATIKCKTDCEFACIDRY